jgi:hypothetical protein
MRRTLLVVLALSCAAAAAAVSATQPSPDAERRAVITLMRAINTAEHAAAAQNNRKFVSLLQLIDHGAMGRVRPDITVNGSSVMYQGSTIRLALSADASQYMVAVSPAQTCGTAVFSDERGLIYAGKVLDC